MWEKNIVSVKNLRLFTTSHKQTIMLLMFSRISCVFYSFIPCPKEFNMAPLTFSLKLLATSGIVPDRTLINSGPVHLNLSVSLSAKIYSIFLSQQKQLQPVYQPALISAEQACDCMRCRAEQSQGWYVLCSFAPLTLNHKATTSDKYCYCIF